MMHEYLQCCSVASVEVAVHKEMKSSRIRSTVAPVGANVRDGMIGKVGAVDTRRIVQKLGESGPSLGCDV